MTRVRVFNDSISTVISNTVHFGLAGALGSTGRTVGDDGTDSGIVRYTPYGTVRTGDVADLAVDQTFTGQTNDPGTGLIDYNARQYDPVLARFIQPDTIVPNISNPQDLNRYMYVGGDPVNAIDVNGHETCDVNTGACWDDFEDSLYGSPWSNTRSNSMADIANFTISNGWTAQFFDVGRDWAAGDIELKPDNFQSVDDFRAISENIQSPFLREVADSVLATDGFKGWMYDLPGTNWGLLASVAAFGICVTPGVNIVGCGFAQVGASAVRSKQRDGTWALSGADIADLTLTVATVGLVRAPVAAAAPSAAGGATLFTAAEYKIIKPVANSILPIAKFVACYFVDKETGSFCVK